MVFMHKYNLTPVSLFILFRLLKSEKTILKIKTYYKKIVIASFYVIKMKQSIYFFTGLLHHFISCNYYFFIFYN